MIFVPVSHLRQSYHILETNPVYLVSTVECLRIHCYTTMKISRRYCADYCPGNFGVDSRQQILERLIKRSPVVDQHSTPTVLHYDHCAALTVLSLFLCKLNNSVIRGARPSVIGPSIAIMEVITGVIEQSAKAVVPRVVLS